MGTIATRMAFGQELIEIAKTNENFVVCNADTKTCGLEKFGKLFPTREFSFGIAEQNLVGASAGLAACGNKVFLATFAVFASMRACEQVRTFVLPQSERHRHRHPRRPSGGRGRSHPRRH